MSSEPLRVGVVDGGYPGGKQVDGAAVLEACDASLATCGQPVPVMRHPFQPAGLGGS